MSKKWFAVAILLALGAGCRYRIPQVSPTGNWIVDQNAIEQLKKTDAAGNGIEVGEPKIYDDASLSLMLEQARLRLAAVNSVNEASLTSRYGSVTGARIEQHQLGVQVTGPSLPGTVITQKGATQETTSNTGLPTSTTLPEQAIVVTQPARDVTTTVAGVTPPPTPTVPAGIAFSAPSGMSGNALDILNEQMQLTYELANLQLLLEGSLSDRFVKNQRLVKPRTTIGFPVSLTPRPPYKDAVAVVEAEVETAQWSSLADEPPAITALLPREKTYNVAAIKDRMTSIGGGAVIGMVGVSGSWMTGKKSYFLVQDQDTVAIQRPATLNKERSVAFAWEFRPVLGQSYIRGGMKQMFVQLSMPLLKSRDCFGKVRLKTYWRRYDQATGVSGDVIPETVLVSSRFISIPNYELKPVVEAVAYQDLGDASLLIKIFGKFFSGTYIQLGPLRFDVAKGLQMEENGLKFVAPAATLARWTPQVISRAGESAEVVQPLFQERLPGLQQSGCAPPAAPDQNQPRTTLLQVDEVNLTSDKSSVEIKMSEITTTTASGAGIYGSDKQIHVVGAALGGDGVKSAVFSAPIHQKGCPGGELRIAGVASRPLNEKETELTVKFQPFTGDFPQNVLLEIGGKVFGLSDTIVRREKGAEHAITLPVSTALVITSPEVRAFVPFQFVADGPRAGKAITSCFVDIHRVNGFEPGAAVERLVLVSVDKDGNGTYLLFGNGLEHICVMVPEKAEITPVQGSSKDHVVLVKISKASLATTKKLVLLKSGAPGPMVLDLPVPDTKPQLPKVTIDSPVIQNADILEVQVENLETLTGVKFGEKTLAYEKGKGAIRLTQLKASQVTTEQKSQELIFEFGDTKVPVKFEVVAARITVK